MTIRASKNFPLPDCALATQAQLGDQRLIAGAIGAVQVVKKTTTLRDHLQKAATRGVVFRVGLEVLGQVGNALRQDRQPNGRCRQ